MVLAMDTWSAACFWLADWIRRSTVLPCSASFFSSQTMGRLKAGLWPCSRRTNSATKASDRGKPALAMAAISRITPLVSLASTASILPARYSAASRSFCDTIMREAMRRRFSMSASRIMMGTAHSSPSLRRCPDWYAPTKAARPLTSSRPSPWATISMAMS